jgi:hypothetical protein
MKRGLSRGIAKILAVGRTQPQLGLTTEGTKDTKTNDDFNSMPRAIAYASARSISDGERFDMTIPAPTNGYSARVRIELYVNGQRFRVKQIGRDKLIFKQPVSLPGTEGEVELRVDEHVQRCRATWEPADEPREVVPVTLRAMQEGALAGSAAEAEPGR